jgi:hypothetical protein
MELVYSFGIPSYHTPIVYNLGGYPDVLYANIIMANTRLLSKGLNTWNATMCVETFFFIRRKCT